MEDLLISEIKMRINNTQDLIKLLSAQRTSVKVRDKLRAAQTEVVFLQRVLNRIQNQLQPQ